jgi:hypothetical protein
MRYPEFPVERASRKKGLGTTSSCCRMGKIRMNIMLNPERVIPNLFRDFFRAGLFQHLIKSMGYETLK